MYKKKVMLLSLIIFLLAALSITLVVVIKSGKDRNIGKNVIERRDAYELYAFLFSDGDFNMESLEELGTKEEKSPYLTVSEAEVMIEQLEEKFPARISHKQENVASFLEKNTRKNDSVLYSDFMELYIAVYNQLKEDTISMEQVFYLADSAHVRTVEEESVSQNALLCCVMNDEGEAASTSMLNLSSKVNASSEDMLQAHTVLRNHSKILYDLSAYDSPDRGRKLLKCVWILSNQPGSLWVNLEDYEFEIAGIDYELKQSDGVLYDTFEDIADLTIEDGKILSVKPYRDKVSGKLLSLQDETVELEGIGTVPATVKFPVYKLYGEREYYTRKDLKIGYDFTDFVKNEDGVIVAALVTREEKMDSIRVVIKTDNFAGAYHESITLTCDADYVVGDEKKLAGEQFTISSGDEVLQSGRIFLKPSVNTAKFTVLSINREQGNPSYRGSMEISQTEQGLLLINEVLLEEYLYSVVPSEMPASYPEEALKAQAICARTYALEHMIHSSLQSYGAHVDDSAAFQVYNNIRENETTTLAIRNTQGSVLSYNGKLAETYYYSTSCGYGTDIRVWHSATNQDYSYMKSRHISGDGTYEDLTDENAMRNYLQRTDTADFEAQEGWYRWQYDSNLDIDRLQENLIKRYEASAKAVLVEQEDGSFVSSAPFAFSKVNNMTITNRLSGGVADILFIETDCGNLEVVGEHAIRSILANTGDHVVRMDGSQAPVSSLLPSAFLVLDLQKNSDTGEIVSYHIQGGGYGHGIGMSQNGAKGMALSGLSCEQILNCFFEGAILGNEETDHFI